MKSETIVRAGRRRSSWNRGQPSRKPGLACRTRRLKVELLEDRRLLSLGPVAGPLESFPFALPGEFRGDDAGGDAKTISPGQSGDGVVDLIVDTDGMTIDTDGVTINSYVISSDEGIFTGQPANNLGVFREDTDYQISGVMGFTLNGTHLLGDVIGEEFDGTDLFQDLRFTYTMEGPGPIYAGTLILASPEAGEMHGSLWDDVSADGVWDAGESTLAGWTVYLDADDDGTFDANERSMLTDADGQYAFLALAPGTYTVAEVVQPAWQQTFPAGDGRHTLTLAPGEHVMNVDFGNCSGGIRGAKWHDIDGDGLRDADEPGLEEWKIYLDLDLDGSWDADEPCTLTDADGQYAFRGLTGGTYTVGEVPWDYWEQTFPGGDGRHSVNVTPGQAVSDVDFGNRRIPGIHGAKWYDLDEDGNRDPGEPGVADWTIYLDANANGQLDWGEPSTLTDRSGRYAVTGIASGTHTVAEVARPGWDQTSPSGDGRHIVTLPADRAVEGVDFGNSWRSTAGSGQHGDGVADLIVTGSGITISTDGQVLRSYSIGSAARVFTGEPANNLGSVVQDEDYLIGALGFTFDGMHFLGYVIGSEFGSVDLGEDLTFSYRIDGLSGAYYGDVIVPSGPAVDVELVALASPTASDEVTALPESLRQVTQDQTFFVEVWLQDTATSDAGILGGYVDLSYTTSQADATALGHGGVFTELPSGRVDDPTGRVHDFGGGTFADGMGADSHWARLGYMECRATGTEQISFSVLPGSVPFVRQRAGNVPWNHVSFPELVLNPEVVGRYVFYNDSAFDGNDAAADAADDGAIATDKAALLPGQTAGLANYTSYSRGINGVMVDVDGLPGDAVLDAADFRFRVGNDDDPAGWSDGPGPSIISVRPGAGLDGSDRITIIWPDRAIQKEWLQVTVLANGHTGLDVPDVFYFGNAVGECGNSITDAKVNATDMLAARNNHRTFIDPAPVDFDYDFDRDGRVNATDVLIARNNQTHFLNALTLITVPGDNSAKEATARDVVFEHEAGRESGRGTLTASMAWLGEFEQTDPSEPALERAKSGQAAFDKLLALYWS